MSGWNLPDDFSWREFDRHFGDDEPPEPDEDTDPDEELIREYWLDHSELTKESL